MATNITVKSPNGESTIYDVSKNDIINVKKGDYVFVPEQSTSLDLQVVDGSLSIKFPDGNNVLVKNVVNLITENSAIDSNGLMDKLDITAISFLDENGDFKEVDFFDKLLALIEDSASGNQVQSINYVDDSTLDFTNKLNIDENSNESTRLRSSIDSVNFEDNGTTDIVANVAPVLILDSNKTVDEDGTTK